MMRGEYLICVRTLYRFTGTRSKAIVRHRDLLSLVEAQQRFHGCTLQANVSSDRSDYSGNNIVRSPRGRSAAVVEVPSQPGERTLSVSGTIHVRWRPSCPV